MFSRFFVLFQKTIKLTISENKYHVKCFIDNDNFCCNNFRYETIIFLCKKNIIKINFFDF